MDISPVLVLMYHQIEPPDVTDGWLPNALADTRYGVGLSNFQEQMEILQKREIPVVGLGDCLDGTIAIRKPLSIVVTFDDGYASDLERAAPILEDFGFPATFFLATGHLGRKGMLTWDQARDLSHNSRFELGSHGVSHRFLSHLSTKDCEQELRDSFENLADLSKLDRFSLSAPGGRTSLRVAQAAKEVGFLSLCTSRPGLFQDRNNRFSIPRLPIMKDMTPDCFQALIDPDSLSFHLNGWIRSSKNLVQTVLELPRTVFVRSGK